MQIPANASVEEILELKKDIEMEDNTLALLFTGFIGLTLLFAQMKMFSIAKDVERIREILDCKQGE